MYISLKFSDLSQKGVGGHFSAHKNLKIGLVTKIFSEF